MKTPFSFLLGTLIFLLLQGIGFAQETSIPEIDRLVATADSLSSIRNYNEAISTYDQAINQLKEAGNWNKLVEVAIDKCVTLRRTGDFLTTAKELEDLLDLSSEKLGRSSALTAMVYHQFGVLRYVEGRNDEAIDHYLNAIEIREEVLGNNHPDLSNTWHNLGVAYRYRGKFSNAIDPLETAIRMRDATGDEKKLADSYNQLGIVYEGLGDFDRSLEYIDLAIDLYKKSVPENQAWLIGDCYRDKGIVFRKKGDIGKSISNFQAGIDVYTELFGENDIDVANGYTNLCGSYVIDSSYTKAKSACQKSINILNKINSTDGKSYLWNYNTLGVANIHLKDYELAEETLNQAVELAKREYGEFHPEVSKSYDNLGDLSLKRLDLATALEFYQKAIINSTANFRSEDPFMNPKLGSDDIIASRTNLLNYISSKGKALYAQYEIEDDARYLEAALHTHELADELVGLILRDFREEGSMLGLVATAIPLYEKAIGVSLEGYRKFTDESWKEKAFRFAERSKAVVLLGSMRTLKAEDYGGIPADILKREANFRQEIAYSETAMEEGVLSNSSDSAILNLRNELIGKKNSYENFVRQLEKDYPEYHNLKYSNVVDDISTIRENLLDSNSVILEYFLGDSNAYLFQISLTEFNVSVIPEISSILQNVSRLTELTSNRATQDESVQTYSQVARQLFVDLIPAGAVEKYERLIIVPDGPLVYLPFGLLLTDEVETSGDFKKLPYLVHSAATSYAYSIMTLLEGNTKLKGTREKVLAMAPVFESSENFNPLIHSRNELKFLDSELDASSFAEGDASKSNFIKESKAYDILHLSTHASIGDGNLERSWIAFSDIDIDSESDYKLYLKDLYALKLKAAMVVLSACETGSGKLERGEGVMSLARGFAYAGCKSVITTLWEVNNQSTSEIVKSFYTYLGAGEMKDQALRLAKLDYLKSQKVDQFSAHPFFWAAYIPIGNVQPLQLQFKLADYYPIMIVLILLLVILTYILLKKTKG